MRDVARIHSLTRCPGYSRSPRGTQPGSSTCRISRRRSTWRARQFMTTSLCWSASFERLPRWHTNRLSRLVKAPKLHMADTGLACALLGIDAGALYGDRGRLGPLLETFVLLVSMRASSPIPFVFSALAPTDSEPPMNCVRPLDVPPTAI
ncbi:MAG TPA: DUF4143 domain-containing protein, partial [Vicinamibacterales bacterium]|nr:DUF4143 domain-containing protein [Vicinamibacterales bacterium]